MGRWQEQGNGNAETRRRFHSLAFLMSLLFWSRLSNTSRRRKDLRALYTPDLPFLSFSLSLPPPPFSQDDVGGEGAEVPGDAEEKVCHGPVAPPQGRPRLVEISRSGGANVHHHPVAVPLIKGSNGLCQRRLQREHEHVGVVLEEIVQRIAAPQGGVQHRDATKGPFDPQVEDRRGEDVDATIPDPDAPVIRRQRRPEPAHVGAAGANKADCAPRASLVCVLLRGFPEKQLRQHRPINCFAHQAKVDQGAVNDRGGVGGIRTARLSKRGQLAGWQGRRKLRV
eukprot:scaffold733_cov267-Pinguiococcus_pyrenoidosus.AAC.56